MLASRREFALGAAAAALGAPTPRVRLILAPSNLGLRPNEDGSEPGAWRAPAALMSAGLRERVNAERVVSLARPAYGFGEQQGTRVRNGHSLRRFSVALARTVRAEREAHAFPLVVGGDCSVLLGAVYGARLAGGRGLVHVDGHSDFFHPGNYDTRARLGSAAGMDLALVTGRGEPLLTQWPDVDGPLVRDDDAVQIGERDALDAAYVQFYADIMRTGITRLIVQDVLHMGVERAAQVVVDRLRVRGIDRAWLHIDLDVLDRAVMSAVDAPGAPGFDFEQLETLLGALLASGRFGGATVAIYDPERDPERIYANPIVAMLGGALARLQQSTI